MRRLAALAGLMIATAAAAAPERVVSINLCTDQLAMLVAAPGQLISVSRFAVDPTASNMVEQASRLAINNATAEPVFLLEPDLVLASSFTSPQTVDLLRRLGVRVEVFAPAATLQDIADDLVRLGALLGREQRARDLAAAYWADLARLAAAARGLPRAPATYAYANGFTAGGRTLEDAILDRAGFDNAAGARGLDGVARLPLELMVLDRPFVVRTRDIGGDSPALANATLDHPALAAVADAGQATLEERWQVCGTPFVGRAIAALIAARRAQPPSPE